jgi:hypothetical protein
MKTLYALIFVCLSFPALADVLDITPIGADEDYAAEASAPAPQPIEDHSFGAEVDFYVDEYNVGSVSSPVMKPIDEAELQGTPRDDDTMIEDEAYTAGVTSPDTPTTEDPIKSGLDFLVDDEAEEFKLPATTGEPSTGFDDLG